MFRQEMCNLTAPYELSVQSASLSVLFLLVTIPGNLFVLLAVLIDPNKNLRNPFNWFVANLAVADLLVGCITDPFSVYLHILESQGLLEKKLQKLLHIPFFISATASVLSLAILSWDRHLAITRPLKYRSTMTSFRAGMITLGIWAISLVLPPIVYMHVGYIRFSFVFENTAVVITFVFLVFTYVRIFQRFRTQMQEWDSLHDSTEESQAQKSLVRWETKVTKTLLIMIALFLMCYLPALVLAYLMNFCHSCSCVVIHWCRDYHFLLVMFSSGLNPFVYAWRLEPYKSSVMMLLKCRFKRPKSVSFNHSKEVASNSSAPPVRLAFHNEIVLESTAEEAPSNNNTKDATSGSPASPVRLAFTNDFALA